MGFTNKVKQKLLYLDWKKYIDGLVQKDITPVH